MKPIKEIQDDKYFLNGVLDYFDSQDRIDDWHKERFIKCLDSFQELIDNYTDLVDFIFDMHPEDELAKGIVEALKNFIEDKQK